MTVRVKTSGGSYASVVDRGTYRSPCEMLDMFGREDADGTYWDSPAWQCTSCGEMVSGIHAELGVLLPPKYCPSCGARAERVVGE